MAKIVTDSDIGTGLEIVAGKLKTNLTKSDLGLGNVNNTSDVDKPVSTATASAIATSVNGLIDDSIADGVTAKAPSQNAVFDALALKAPLASPDLTGTPTAPTATAGTNTTQLATTAFVTNGLNGKQNTLTNPITGSLTTNYLPKATGSTTLGNSQIFDDGTNVGIGTTSPVAKLDVRGDLNLNYGTGISFGDGTAAAKYAIINTYTTDDVLQLQAAGASNGIITFHSGGASSLRTERMRITSGGNVGIGTYAPAGILDVTSTSQGSLPFPRMTSSQRTDISSPPTGMHVYQTDVSEGLYVKESTGWQRYVKSKYNVMTCRLLANLSASNIMENTFDVAPTFSKGGTGIYYITMTGKFNDLSKQFFISQVLVPNTISGTHTTLMQQQDNNTVILRYYENGIPIDAGQILVEIRVYN